MTLAAASMIPPSADSSPPDQGNGLVIKRDRYGVPHIYGPTDASVAFGVAWAQAEDAFEQLEETFLLALGRGAELHGERRFESDRLARAMEHARLAREEYARAPTHMRAIYDGYAEGLTAFARRIRPRLLETFEPWLPLAVLRYKYHQLEFLDYAGLTPGMSAERWEERPTGSNAWAIGPGKSASGNAMLLINPHVGFFGPAQYYEHHVVNGEGWNFSGVGRLGLPFPYMGRNERLGWGHTDNYPDHGDLYAETFVSGSDPLSYRHGEATLQAVAWKERVRIRTAGGFEDRDVAFRRTHHGPILGVRDGKPIAVRLAKAVEGGWL
ncbi:penicillin acylase family protein, partial [Brevundimonas sp.]|uniref:penicillin acylase family protein n=1 Tax=Brevundimonas sp. TaxID=1871086 RepID=UPI002ED7BC8F